MEFLENTAEFFWTGIARLFHAFVKYFFFLVTSVVILGLLLTTTWLVGQVVVVTFASFTICYIVRRSGKWMDKYYHFPTMDTSSYKDEQNKLGRQIGAARGVYVLIMIASIGWMSSGQPWALPVATAAFLGLLHDQVVVFVQATKKREE